MFGIQQNERRQAGEMWGVGEHASIV